MEAPNAAATGQSPQETTKVSKGEKLFDWLTYGGIAGVGTFLVTIPIAYWAKYGGGAKYFDAASKKIMQMTGRSEATAHDIVMTTALMQGGNLTLLPVKAMEDNKIELVKFLDKKIGVKTNNEQLQAEPKQGWLSIIKSRVVAWLVVFSSLKTTSKLIGPEKFAQFEDNFAKHVVCEPLGLATHINGVESKAFRYGKIGAIDLFATAAATSILYLASKFFAKYDQDHQQKNVSSHMKTMPIEPTESSVVKEKAPFADKVIAQKEKAISQATHLSY